MSTRIKKTRRAMRPLNERLEAQRILAFKVPLWRRVLGGGFYVRYVEKWLKNETVVQKRTTKALARAKIHA
jgi:hypothetical protein